MQVGLCETAEEGKMSRSHGAEAATRINRRCFFGRLIIAGLFAITAVGSILLPFDRVLRILSTEHVSAQGQTASMPGSPATEGTSPGNLQTSEPNPSSSTPGRQVLIDFSNLPFYTTVTNQYPDAIFSSDSSNYVLTTPQNYATGLPNISRAYVYGYWVNGNPPYNHFAPLVVNFPKPVNDLAFHLLASDDVGVIAYVDIDQTNVYTKTEPIFGNGNPFSPIWINLGAAGYKNVTRIVVRAITDRKGLAFDNFSFTVPAATPTPTPTPSASPTPTPPPAPTNVKAKPDEEEIFVSWAPSQGAAWYIIKRTEQQSTGSTREPASESLAFAPINSSFFCDGVSIPCVYPDDNSGVGLSSDITYYYRVVAANNSGTSAESDPEAAAKPLPRPGCTSSPTPTPAAGATGAFGWTMNYEFSPQDGLVIYEVYLNGKRMADQMSVPYFLITTRNATSPNLVGPSRGELRTAGTQSTLRSRLTGYKINPPDQNKLVIEANYAIDRIPGTPKACLNITQKYEFYRAGASPDDLQGPCEPSGTATPCNKFRPMLEYSFHGGDGEFLSSLNTPMRLHFQDTVATGNTVALTRDYDRFRDVLAHPVVPFRTVYNPLSSSWWSQVIVQRSPTNPDKSANKVDNFHQTNDKSSVTLPGLGLSGLTTQPYVLPAGCPECVHFHWRWSSFVPGPNFRNGTPLVPPGSDQTVDIEVVPFKNVFENYHPTDYVRDLYRANEPIRNPTNGVNQPYDVVLWYSPTGSASSDTFFWHTAWFTPSRIEYANTVSLSQSSTSEPSSSESQDGPVSVTFGTVYESGNTTFSAYDLNTLPALPPGYTALNSAAYFIDTTAIVGGPHVVNFTAASIANQSVFNDLRIFYVERDPFDPERPTWIDATIQSPDSPSPNFSSKTLSARTERLGVFVIGTLVQTVPPATDVANLRVSSGDSADPVMAGNNLTYTVTVANEGPQAANEVALKDLLSPDVEFVSATPSQGTCKELDGVVYCGLNSLAVGASVTVAVVVKPSEGTTSFPAEGKMIANITLIRAKEKDNDATNNWIAEETRVIPSPNAPPIVQITSPVTGTMVVGPTNVTINAVASDVDGTITKVEFFDNGEFIGTGAPGAGNSYSVTKVISACQSTANPEGNHPMHAEETPCSVHTFRAVATDNGGRQNVSTPIDVIVNGTATVSITNPTSGAFFSPNSQITLGATASHPSGFLSEVEFFANGQSLGHGTSNGASQYTLTLDNVSAGGYSIFAVARDGSGISTMSAPINITVGTPPTVTMTTPADGTVFPSLTNISVSATAQSAHGSIVRVDFYANGILIASASDVGTNQFTATWRHLADGFYSVTAIATDNLGVSNTAAPITIGVNTPTPRPGEFIWFDDSLPPGAVKHTESEDWYWVDANPGAFSGTKSHQSRSFWQSGFHQHYFDGATTTLPVSAGDKLFTYVFLDGNNLPREIMLQWKDATGWEHRGYWGANNIAWGADGTNSRRYMGPLPVAGQWLRLEVPADAVGLEGATLNGMAFSLDGGRATFDLAGKTTANAPPPPTTQTGDFVWIEDELPAGAIPAVVDDSWTWVINPHYSGQAAHLTYFASDGGRKLRSHSFADVQTPMQVNPGDVLFTYVYMGDPDPAHPANAPDQIMLQWYDGTSWEHRAFWGVNYIGTRVPNMGVLGTENQRYMGGLPPLGRSGGCGIPDHPGWCRLEVPASYIGLEGKAVSGMAFTSYRDQNNPFVAWDQSGKSSGLTSVPLPLSSTTGVFRSNSTNHGYTFETPNLAPAGFTLGNVAFHVNPKPAPGTIPFNRFLNSNGTERFYSRFSSHSGWVPAGVAFHVLPDANTPGTVPLYLYHNSVTQYLMTLDPNEAVSLGYPYSDGVWAYVYPNIPAAPTSLAFNGCDLTWTDNSDNESGFKIEKRRTLASGSGGKPPKPGQTGRIVWQEIATVPANVTSFTVGCPTSGYHRVRAYNSTGSSSPSNTATGFLKEGEPSPNTAPEINISSPAEGDVLDHDFAIFANAFDVDGNGTISKVEFFANGMKVGEVANAPHILPWNNVASGPYSLTAVVTDNEGATKTSAAVNVTVDSPPAVSITSPASGAIVNGPSISISASASDNDGTISKVEFFQGGIKLGEDTNVPFAFDWNSVAAGSYVLTAIATDNLGRTTASSPVSITVNSAPTVSITMPTNGTVFTAPAEVTLGAGASDSDGSVDKVDFYQGATLLGTDATSPYSFTWTNVSSGSYSIAAKATDNVGGVTASAPISITVNALPNVSISSPASGASFVAPANIIISAVASDDGSISKVEIFQGSSLIGTDTVSPYSFNWINVPIGSYSLTAKATDNLGATTTSNIISILVVQGSTSNKIAFASNREGIAQIYSMNSDGSNLFRLTTNAANDESPKWSPNNSRIVFQSDRDNPFCDVFEIYSMNSDGSGQARLTTDINDDRAPVWSPDGSKIAFQSMRNGVNYQVYVMNADGSGQVNITNSTSNDTQPSWSPDGSKIAFASDRDQAGFPSIYVMNANGSNQTRLSFSSNGFLDDQPAWSPDGTKVAFTSTRDSTVATWEEWILREAVVNKEIYVMNADGSAQARLTNIMGNDDSPTWSPDGTRIAFRSDRYRDCCDPYEQVWVMNADGSNQVNLSNNQFGDHCPSWSR
jgi:uncharacterized repeat protein (TIGR01451 family)